MNFSSTRLISPISKGEFLQMFQRCTPPTGWAPKVAVAQSGGPDSTCLLFLLNRLFFDETMTSKGLPTSVVSLTVDHGLQASSSLMAKHCLKTASSLGFPHLTLPIPWGQPPFPERPADAGAFEQIARDARYHVLFDAMTRMNVNTLALGHHIDDQVETSLMRLARGTTEIGAGGMRPCRRWGMGLGKNIGDGLGWFGYEGMNRWIVRPLLEVSKDRILATCEKNGLEYVTDPTNFQPEATLRNAIRQMLVEEDAVGSGKQPESRLSTAPLPQDIKEKLVNIKEATAALRTVHYDVSGGTEQLRGAVKVLSSRVSDIDNEVDRHLKYHTVPCPLSTFLLSLRDLLTISDPTVRAAIVMRVMRYVSFQPWGSPRAEGNRRKNSIQRIVDNIWTPNPYEVDMSHFVAGSGVLWRPLVISRDSLGNEKMRPLQQRLSETRLFPGDRFGWLATRQPPFCKTQRLATNNLEIDLSPTFTRAINEGRRKTSDGPLDILYDCRFLLRFDLAKMPERIARSLALGHSRLRVDPRTRWYWPRILWDRPGFLPDILATIPFDAQDPVGPLPLVQPSDWIRIYWIRTMEAI